MTRQKIIIMADARSRIALNDSHTLKRHKEYIEQFAKFEKFENTALYVIQPTLKIFRGSITNFENLTIFRVSIKNVLLIKRFISREKYEVILLVAGDPWESYFFSFLLKCLLFNFKIPIQLQIHAELSNAWAKLSFRNRIRRLIALGTLKKAQGIRVVSEEQRKYLSKRLSISSEHIVTVPVRLNLEKPISPLKFEKHSMSIGLVGRIHKERNIEKFVEVARYFLGRIPDLRIVIAGNSGGSNKLVSLLRGISTSQVDFLGNLASTEMESVWSQIGVLISPAESESYGRSIREALLHGVPVLAFSSMGSRDLKNECPDSVQLFTEMQSLPELFELYELLRGSRVPRDFAMNQILRDSKISSQIAVSWRETIEWKTIG